MNADRLENSCCKKNQRYGSIFNIFMVQKSHLKDFFFFNDTNLKKTVISLALHTELGSYLNNVPWALKVVAKEGFQKYLEQQEHQWTKELNTHLDECISVLARNLVWFSRNVNWTILLLLSKYFFRFPVIYIVILNFLKVNITKYKEEQSWNFFVLKLKMYLNVLFTS